MSIHHLHQSSMDSVLNNQAPFEFQVDESEPLTKKEFLQNYKQSQAQIRKAQKQEAQQ